jgi:hypothetical protein
MEPELLIALLNKPQINEQIPPWWTLLTDLLL